MKGSTPLTVGRTLLMGVGIQRLHRGIEAAFGDAHDPGRLVANLPSLPERQRRIAGSLGVLTRYFAVFVGRFALLLSVGRLFVCRIRGGTCGDTLGRLMRV